MRHMVRAGKLLANNILTAPENKTTQRLNSSSWSTPPGLPRVICEWRNQGPLKGRLPAGGTLYPADCTTIFKLGICSLGTS